jgi:hypothetical protein
LIFFHSFIEFFFHFEKLKLIPNDPLCASGSKSANVLAVLGGVAADALDLTGFYYSGKPFITKRKPQLPIIQTAPP